jgi:GT2 family glycosyltransferase
MSDLSVIIVSYNTSSLLRSCLRSVYAETQTDLEVVVVDNASVDGSAEMVSDEFPDVKVIALTENIGFGRAANLGVAASGGGYIILLNPDTVVLDGALDRLVAFTEDHPETGLCGGRTLSPDGSLDPRSCWAGPTLWSVFCFATGLSTAFRTRQLFDPESMGRWARDSVRTVDIVTGCLLAAPRAVWDELGGFNERFFMYGEDADLSLRAAAAGYRPTITPDATIIHVVGASSGSDSDKKKLLLAGKVTLLQERWKPTKALIGCRLLLGGVAFRAAVATATRRRSPYRRLWQERSAWQGGFPRSEVGSSLDPLQAFEK